MMILPYYHTISYARRVRVYDVCAYRCCSAICIVCRRRRCCCSCRSRPPSTHIRLIHFKCSCACVHASTTINYMYSMRGQQHRRRRRDKLPNIANWAIAIIYAYAQQQTTALSSRTTTTTIRAPTDIQKTLHTNAPILTFMKINMPPRKANHTRQWSRIYTYIYIYTPQNTPS